MKPYQQIPIADCGERLVPIPLENFAVVLPPPYAALGADYGGHSPYCLRQSVLEALSKAQHHLQQLRPGWKIQVFDAYRPVEVQQFMVDYTFAAALAARKLTLVELSVPQQQALWEEVYQMWAVPSADPATPPPHSTGAAVDVRLLDAAGEIVEMGGEIDELSARSHPDYYTRSPHPQAANYCERRQLLSWVMREAGFAAHPGEWWHFSLGDQMWAWLTRSPIARYGRWDLGGQQ